MTIPLSFLSTIVQIHPLASPRMYDDFDGLSVRRLKDRSNGARVDALFAGCTAASRDPERYIQLASTLAVESCSPELLDRILGSLIPEQLHSAPGPDGVRLGDLARADWRDRFRALSRDAEQGRWLRPRYRPATIPKFGSLKGRDIEIPNWIDRIQQRALVEIISRLLEPHFAWFSLGFRRGQGVHTALMLAERLILQGERWHVLVHDIEGAFANVRIPRLRDVALRIFGERKFVERTLVMSQADGRGLAAGSPVSPHLLNLYLHELLDVVCGRRHTSPFIRYADDLLFAEGAPAQTQSSQAAAAAALGSQGMKLRAKNYASRAADLRRQKIDYLGFKMNCPQGEMRYEFGEGRIDRLRKALRQGMKKEDAILCARDRLHGWIKWQAPVWDEASHGKLVDQLRTALRRESLEELLAGDEIVNRWRSAHARWNAYRASYRFEFPLEGPRRIRLTGNIDRSPGTTSELFRTLAIRSTTPRTAPGPASPRQVDSSESLDNPPPDDVARRNPAPTEPDPWDSETDEWSEPWGPWGEEGAEPYWGEEESESEGD